MTNCEPQHEIYSQATHYTCITEGEKAPNEYSEITEKEQVDGYSAIGDTSTCTTKNGMSYTAGYSVITNEEQLAGYSVIGDTITTSKEEIPAGYSVITQDDSNDGLVYSAVVRQDGIKTTVKTTAQLDEQQQQSVSDTSNDGLVYSAVVRQDGIKTTVKTTVFKDNMIARNDC